MDVVVTLIYLLFSMCVICPPTEFVAAGFTIPLIFEGFLGSENTNFIGYHMKRITLTAFIHSCLPLGYVFSLWCGGLRGPWMAPAAIATAIIPIAMCYKIILWWEYDKSKHPVVRPLVPYAQPGSDWRVIANDINVAYKSIDKVCLQLTATSKFVVTEIWIIRVTQYGMNLVKHCDCSLVATASDVHDLSLTGDEEVQYINIKAIPSRLDIEPFTIRMTTVSLRELQQRLQRPIHVPENIALLPTLVERFITVFKHQVEQNPIYYVDQELEQCIGCMQNMADVKIDRRCMAPPPPMAAAAPPPCQQCNCRVLWCCSCMARWWAARVGGAGGAGGRGAWLEARGTCPVCRATFCVRDVLPARVRDL